MREETMQVPDREITNAVLMFEIDSIRKENIQLHEKCIALIESNKKSIEDATRGIKKLMISLACLERHNHDKDGKAVVPATVASEAVYSS